MSANFNRDRNTHLLLLAMREHLASQLHQGIEDMRDLVDRARFEALDGKPNRSPTEEVEFWELEHRFG